MLVERFKTNFQIKLFLLAKIQESHSIALKGRSSADSHLTFSVNHLKIPLAIFFGQQIFNKIVYFGLKQNQEKFQTWVKTDIIT